MLPSPPRPDLRRAAPTLARLDDVCVRLGDHDALGGVTLRVVPGGLTVLTGPNGAGKSTLVEVLAGVRPPTSGRVEVAASSVAFVPQRAAVPDRLPVTVRDVVTMGAWGRAGLWRRVGREDRARVDAAMALLGLTPLARRSFAVLSGGERQRALLAQGLTRGADLLLVDEPTTGLDTLSATHICEALDREVARGVGVVCVSHDPVVIGRADRVVRLEDGRVVADAEVARRSEGRVDRSRAG